MDPFTFALCTVVAALCTAHMIRPVSKSEKAYLLDLASDGDDRCREIADNAVAKKWLTWTGYDAARQAIQHIKAKRNEEAMLAESAARKALRDARKKA